MYVQALIMTWIKAYQLTLIQDIIKAPRSTLSLITLFVCCIYTHIPCEGCFCYIATRRAEGDHYMDLNFREGVVEPKIQPRAINSAQGLMGYFQKGILKSQDNKAPINMEKD